MKVWLSIFILSALAVPPLGAYWFLSYRSGIAEDVVLIDVAPGRSFTHISEDLAQQELVASAWGFRLYARFKGVDRQLKVAEYELHRGMSPLEILNTLTSGKGKSYSITIPEGTNLFEVAAALAAKGFGAKSQFLELFQSKALARELLKADVEDFEGYLYPETYFFSKYTTPKEILRALVARFEIVFRSLPKNSRSGLTPHQIVTLASVVEKETGASQERPLIASVFFNRLRLGMKLQSDPTIIYGIWRETGQEIKNIRRRDILSPTAYNTYTVSALPKGPIANPGREALQAVIQPAESDYIYFVSRNDGTHVFSKTLQEHNQAVKAFQLDSKARMGKSWRQLSAPGNPRPTNQ